MPPETWPSPPVITVHLLVTRRNEESPQSLGRASCLLSSYRGARQPRSLQKVRVKDVLSISRVLMIQASTEKSAALSNLPSVLPASLGFSSSAPWCEQRCGTADGSAGDGGIADAPAPLCLSPSLLDSPQPFLLLRHGVQETHA